MATVVTPTSELEAINLMLDTIGESPISSLSDSAVVDAVKAKAVLSEVSRAVQTKGWHFNIEKAFKLTPTLYEKALIPPSNTLQVDTVGDSALLDLVHRGNRLYDRRKHTFEFDAGVTVDLVVLLPFDQLPEAARRHIAIRAARTFQQRTLGSDTLYAFTKDDERESLADLKRAEGVTGDHNMLTGSHATMRILRR